MGSSNGALWSAIAGGASGLLGSIISSITASNAQRRTDESNERNVNATNQTSIDIARENNEFQRQMNDVNNQFSHNEADLARQFSHSEAELAYQRELEKMQMEQKYNSPLEQLKRYREAGINPSVAFAGNLGTATSAGVSAPMAQSSQATPHGSGVSPSMPSLVPYQHIMPFNVAGGIMDGLLKTSEIIKAFAESKKTNEEANVVSKLALSQIKEEAARTRAAEIANQTAALYGDREARARINNLVVQAFTSASEGKVNEARVELVRTEAALNRALRKLHGEQRESYRLSNETFMQRFRADVEKTLSEAQAARSASNASETQAQYNLQQLRTSEAQREKFVQETIEAIERTKGIHLDNHQKNRLRPFILEQVELDLRRQNQDLTNPFRYVGALLNGYTGSTINALTASPK